MKIALVCVLFVAYIAARPEEYTHKYDNIDVDQILHNDRLLNRYVDCLLERNKVKCPPEATEIKKDLSEALANECAKCSDKQKEIVKKVIKFLAENKKPVWEELKMKYDPEGLYAKKYEDLAKEENVQI